jgi:hypothetical protein
MKKPGNDKVWAAAASRASINQANSCCVENPRSGRLGGLFDAYREPTVRFPGSQLSLRPAVGEDHNPDTIALINVDMLIN